MDIKKEQYVSQNIQNQLNYQNRYQRICDEEELLTEDIDQLISEKGFQQNIIEEDGNNGIQSNQDHIIKVYFTKSQKKQKIEYEFQVSQNANCQQLRSQNIIFSQLLKDSDNQCSVMSLELDENLLDLENLIELEYQQQNKPFNKSDPILIIDNNERNMQEQNQQGQRDTLNSKKSHDRVEKENYNPNILNQSKNNNKSFLKENVMKINKDIYEERKPSMKKNIQQISPKQLFPSKKSIKCQEKSLQKLLKFHISEQQIHLQYNSAKKIYRFSEEKPKCQQEQEQQQQQQMNEIQI